MLELMLLADSSRKTRKLGGVAIYVNQALAQNAFAMDVSSFYEELCCEVTMIKIKSSDETIRILGIYCSTKGNTMACINILTDILDNTHAHNKLTVIIGDINIDNMKAT